MIPRILVAVFVSVSALVTVGCASETGSTSLPFDRERTGPLMRSGENCLACHREGGEANRKKWTAAGTVFRGADAAEDEGVEGATVIVTDAKGKEVRLTTNAVGNFYTPQALDKPLHMAIEYEGRRAEMPVALDAEGACNACHSHPDPIGDAKGRIRVP